MLPPSAMKTYAIRSPLATHTRVATCREVECVASGHGWTTTIDEATNFGKRQAGFIRTHSGRHYTETRTPAGLTEFSFPAGQRCFTQHRVSLERPEFYFVHPGDNRLPVRPDDITRHARAADWVDDFATHQDRLQTVMERG
jgi:hypothetical protein